MVDRGGVLEVMSKVSIRCRARLATYLVLMMSTKLGFAWLALGLVAFVFVDLRLKSEVMKRAKNLSVKHLVGRGPWALSEDDAESELRTPPVAACTHCMYLLLQLVH